MKSFVEKFIQQWVILSDIVEVADVKGKGKDNTIPDTNHNANPNTRYHCEYGTLNSY